MTSKCLLYAAHANQTNKLLFITRSESTMRVIDRNCVRHRSSLNGLYGARCSSFSFFLCIKCRCLKVSPCFGAVASKCHRSSALFSHRWLLFAFFALFVMSCSAQRPRLFQVTATDSPKPAAIQQSWPHT